jgi:hypothetical protein
MVKPRMWALHISRIVETASIPLTIALDETCRAFAKRLAHNLPRPYLGTSLSGAYSAVGPIVLLAWHQSNAKLFRHHVSSLFRCVNHRHPLLLSRNLFLSMVISRFQWPRLEELLLHHLIVIY